MCYFFYFKFCLIHSITLGRIVNNYHTLVIGTPVHQFPVNISNIDNNQ